MTISYVNQGTRVAGALSPLSVPYPATVTSGNLLILLVADKYSTTPCTPDTPTGWTQQHQRAGGNGAPGNDSGSMYVTVFTKIADGSESGNLSVSFTGTINVAMCQIAQYSKTTGSWGIACSSGVDSTADTSWSVTADADPGVTAGDMLLALSGQNGNLSLDMTVEAMSQTGVTFGTMVERIDDQSSTGNDEGFWLTEHPVSSGTGSAAPVYTATASASGTNSPTGPTVFMRLREVAAASPGVRRQSLLGAGH